MSAIGIDTGGTFTDFIWLDEGGRLRLHKQPSTPADPSAAVLAGLAEGGAPAAAGIVHGSTVATNALLQRRGARTALIATAGFADVLAIGRQNRPDLYALVPQKPAPLVPDAWRFEAQERVNAAGEIERPLDEAALDEGIDRIAAAGIESVAVCLLFSFLQPEHERRIAARLAERLGPALHVSLSCDILPEYREFERTAATVINAYVAPLMSRYLTRLAQRVAPRRLTVMQSNGGVISAAMAGAQAARTALSGPAGGVVGARTVAAAAGPDGAGYADVITFDMGGTSTDVALCDGRAPTTTEGEIAGLPLRLPLLDIHTVGAGGGSLAYLDAGGALQVGPQSAGADPGPAAYHADYDRWQAHWTIDHRPLPTGGVLPSSAVRGPSSSVATVTDANLVLGRLSAAHFLGGHMPLYPESAAAAVGALAAGLGVPAERAALAVVRVANATMERAIRRISVERGHDPRRFTLVAFGGGGPLHACELAAELRIPRVLVPLTPGVLSALGLLAAAPARDYSRTVLQPLGDLPAAALAALFAPLLARGAEEMAAEGHAPATLSWRRALDVRYAGQSHELTVVAPPGAAGSDLAAAFHAAHAARYGYARPEAAVELVNARLTATAPGAPPALPREARGPATAAAAVVGRQAVWFAGGPLAADLYDRQRLRAGQRFAGPAVVYQYDTTTLVPPGWQAAVDERLNLIVEPERAMERLTLNG